MHNATPLITTIVGSLSLAFIMGMLAHRLRVSPIVGYLAAGVLIGPFTPGFVADTSLAPELAEIGVILLMFSVGLHFPLKDLLSVKAIAIPGAIIQIAITTFLGTALAMVLGWGVVEGMVFGLALSAASTVVLLRALEDRKLTKSRPGQIAIGWLIIEDLAMVLILMLLPTLAGTIEQPKINSSQLLLELVTTLSKVIIFMVLMIGIGSRLVPWVLAKSSKTRSNELFTLAVLTIALGIAYGAVEIFDVSFALGAFFAGMVLNKSEHSHRAEHDTLSIRNAFGVLFFVSVGMLLDPMVLWDNPLALLSTTLIIILGKSVVAYVLVRLLGQPKLTALSISISLAQIGEFSFILAGVGISLGLLSKQLQGLILAGAILSIMLNPLLFSLLERYKTKQKS